LSPTILLRQEATVPAYLEVPLPDGEVLLVEVNAQEVGLVPAAGRDVRERLAEGLRDGLSRVREFIGEVHSSVRALPEPPDRVAVELGLKLTAKTGVVVAESAAEGHLAVTVEWQRPTVAPVLPATPTLPATEPS
jgi:Trypsin-co-occurring domain 1